MNPSLIGINDHFTIIFFLLAASVLGIYGERVGWFRNISGVVVTIMVASILVTLEILPFDADQDIKAPAYQFVFNYLVPISIPLLLFNVNLKRIINESGRLLVILVGFTN